MMNGIVLQGLGAVTYWGGIGDGSAALERGIGAVSSGGR